MLLKTPQDAVAEEEENTNMLKEIPPNPHAHVEEAGIHTITVETQIMPSLVFSNSNKRRLKL